MKILYLIIFFSITTLLTACKKDDKQKILDQKELNLEKEILIDINKNFKYQCLKISTLHDIDYNKVAIVLKEIFINYSVLDFENNSTNIIGYENYYRKQVTKLDLYNNIKAKNIISDKEIFTILNAIENDYQIEDFESIILYLSDENDYLNDQIEKNEN